MNNLSLKDIDIEIWFLLERPGADHILHFLYALGFTNVLTLSDIYFSFYLLSVYAKTNKFYQYVYV